MTKERRFSNVIGFDDAPFTPAHVGPVPVVGAVFARLLLTGVIIGAVEKDGRDAAEQLARLVAGSKFAEHIQLVMLQGIALAGFNVVDIGYLHEQLGLPVLVVARKEPDLAAVQRALLGSVQGGREKWALIEKLGPMEPAGAVCIQRAGLSLEEAQAVVVQFAVHSHLPEPLRTAHLIAGALVDGQSRGRV
jgi:endonuclease V-like protein UPF0215 family